MRWITVGTGVFLTYHARSQNEKPLSVPAHNVLPRQGKSPLNTSHLRAERETHVPLVGRYRNHKTTHNGIQFDSRKEADRYQELLLLERAGLLSNIELQPRYDLIVNGHKLGFYRADFRYKEVTTGTVITEDVKSPVTKTAVYRLKKKLVEALYGVEIVEV